MTPTFHYDRNHRMIRNKDRIRAGLDTGTVRWAEELHAWYIEFDDSPICAAYLNEYSSSQLEIL